MTDPSPTEVRPTIVYVQPRQTPAWIIAIALAVIATVVALRPDAALLGAALAQNQLAGSGGLHAFTGQLDKDRYGLFMMDVENGTVWVYEYVPLKRRLKLVCARDFTYDRYLKNFNNDEQTTPKQIEEMVKREREALLRAGKPQPSPAAAPSPGVQRPAAPGGAAPRADEDIDEIDVDALPDEPGDESPSRVETGPGANKNKKGQP